MEEKPLGPPLKKKICVIVNPISGKGKNRFLAEKIQSAFDADQYETELLFSQAPHHSTELARQAVAKKADVVVAVGGDGSINEIGQGLIGSQTALAIIPTGAGNGLARHLKIPRDLNKALNVVKQGHLATIDAVQLNDRFFFTAAGIGFDAEIGWAFSKFGHRGFFSYLLVTLREFLRHRPSVYELSIDGTKLSREAFLISFANGSQFGNGAVIAPNAQIDDGSVDVVILKKFPLFAAPRLAYQLFNRTIDRSKYVEVFQAKNISLNQPILKWHVDGEPVLFQGNMQVSVIPSALKVIV